MSTAQVLAHPAAPVATAPSSLGAQLQLLLQRAAVSLTAGAITPLTLSVDLALYGADRGSRLADQLAALLRELGVTAAATQKVLVALAEAIDEGFLDEVRGGLRNISAAVELMATVSEQLDQAMPVLDATTPTLKVMNSTLAQLNSTIAQLEALPGVRMARRFVGRPGTPELL